VDETERFLERLAEQDRLDRDRRDNADAAADQRAWQAKTREAKR